MMSPELDANLCARFPLLYADRHGSPSETLMCNGFTCGDGWFAILETLSEGLEALIRAQPEDTWRLFRADQVKEKFGGLRFYMRASTPEMNEHIHRAEDLSERTCEVCGAPGGKVMIRHLIATRCPEHATS